MPDRAKQLMELLGCHIGEPEALPLAANPEALDLDATQFLNPEPGELNTLVLDSDSHGRQLIVDRVSGDTRACCPPPGHRRVWRVWAEVICWTVQVSIRPRTAPGYTIPLGVSSNSEQPDSLGELSKRYEPFGAHLELADTARFPGATFTITLFAKTIAVGPYLWTMTGRETLEPLPSDVEAKARGRPQTRRPGKQAKRGGE